jgi:hypothetical protein
MCHRRLSRLSGVSLALVGVAWAGAGPPIGELNFSADISAQFGPGAQFAHDHDYVADRGGTLVRLQLPNLPESADLDALHLDSNGDVLFSLDTGVRLGGVYYDRGDAIRYSGGVYTSAFDASAAGVPGGVNLDALSRRNGRLLVSFDRALTAGTTYFPGDVIEVDGGALGTRILHAAALGLSPALNVDAIDALGGTSHLLVSFDRGGAIGAVRFADEDVVEFDLGASTWSLRIDMSLASNRWDAADLDALAAGSDVIFMHGFE